MKGFDVVDITHKPRRTQNDNIAASGRSADNPESAQADTPATSVPLHGVTIERAIQYYEAHADGELRTLYSATAKWLREHLTISRVQLNKALKEAQESEVAQNEKKEVEIQESGKS